MPLEALHVHQPGWALLKWPRGKSTALRQSTSSPAACDLARGGHLERRMDAQWAVLRERSGRGGAWGSEDRPGRGASTQLSVLVRLQTTWRGDRLRAGLMEDVYRQLSVSHCLVPQRAINPGPQPTPLSLDWLVLDVSYHEGPHSGLW